MEINAKKTALIPLYMKDFQCIADRCEYSCCEGWKITLDKKTYKKYKNCRHESLKTTINESIRRNRKEPSDINYGIINMNEELKCPFLSSNKLCEIHSNLGEEYLSNTCYNYPRKYNVVDGVIEISASASCPEIARVAFLNDKVMEFERVEMDVNISRVIGGVINTKKTTGLYSQFWEIRMFTIQVLQCREYELWERLVILGLFYQTVQNSIENNNLDEIQEYIVEYIEGIEKGAFDKELRDVPSNCNVQLDILNQIIEKKVAKGFVSEPYVDCYNKFLKGIKQNSKGANDELIKNYENNYSTYYLPYMKKNQYILENYLVNYVFSSLFPFGKSQNLYDSYVLMIIHYCLIKMHLIGMSGFYKDEFSTSHVIKLLYSYSRVVEHDNSFLKDIMEFFKNNEYSTLSHMLLLIKN